VICRLAAESYYKPTAGRLIQVLCKDSRPAILLVE
jgi:hypothetical protein